MNKKKIIIAVLVIFIVLVAVIALVLKTRVKSGAPVPNFVKTSFSDWAKTDASTTDASTTDASTTAASNPAVRKNAAGEFLDSDGNVRKVDTSIKSELPVFLPPAVESIETTGPSLRAMPGSPEAPKQEVVAADKVPAQAIRIDISDKGFSPKEFRVKSGAEVTLALNSTDGNTHVFVFPSASLMGLTVMVLDGSIKTVTFNAPKAGSYLFRDDIPAYRANTGMMIVE